MSSISANPLLKPAFWGKDNKNNRKGFCNLVAKAPVGLFFFCRIRFVKKEKQRPTIARKSL